MEVGPEIVRFEARGPATNGAAIEALLGAMVAEPRFDEGAFPDAVRGATSLERRQPQLGNAGRIGVPVIVRPDKPLDFENLGYAVSVTFL